MQRRTDCDTNLRFVKSRRKTISESYEGALGNGGCIDISPTNDQFSPFTCFVSRYLGRYETRMSQGFPVFRKIYEQLEG